MFSIVEWIEWDPLCVSVVPSNWLVNEGNRLLSHWSPAPANESLIKKRCPPKPNWPKYPVRMLGKAGNNCYICKLTFNILLLKCLLKSYKLEQQLNVPRSK
jgi:hypothetical protein